MLNGIGQIASSLTDGAAMSHMSLKHKLRRFEFHACIDEIAPSSLHVTACTHPPSLLSARHSVEQFLTRSNSQRIAMPLQHQPISSFPDEIQHPT
uniref:Uncharacterized protein n=1 Tax=Echinococcus canadensis TaxID=519352 RepID=A0A915ET86_9CEST